MVFVVMAVAYFMDFYLNLRIYRLSNILSDLHHGIFFPFFDMAACERGNTYDEFLYDLYYDIYWLEGVQRLTIARLVEVNEPKKVHVSGDCYIIDLWELRKSTVELIAKQTRRFKSEWEEQRRLRWQSSQSTPLVPLSGPSSSAPASTSLETSAEQSPPVPKLVLRLQHPSASKSVYSCQLKDNGLKEKPVASTKRKAEDDLKFQNKRPVVTMDPRLKRIFGKKQPRNISRKNDAERFNESVRRAKLAMEKRGR